MAETQFKVMWRFPKSKKETVRNFICKDLGTLLKMLERSEGVTQLTVDELCIHAIGSDGKVRELFATGNAPLPKHEETTTARDLVVSTLNGPVKKPRIRIKPKPYVDDPTRVEAAMGLYSARAAVSKEVVNG